MSMPVVAWACAMTSIINRLIDPDRTTSQTLQPPSWTMGRDVLWFQLTIPSARVPSESEYVGLSGSNTVSVDVNDTIGSALPEFCFVLATPPPRRCGGGVSRPTGDIVDFLQYDENIQLPDMVPQDEWASMSAMLTVQFDGPPAKRLRPSGP